MVKTTFIILIVCCLPVLALGQIAQREYGAEIGDSVWISYTVRGSCLLYHPIPEFGEAVFTRRPGTDLSFVVRRNRGALTAKQATLVAVPPAWRQDLKQQELLRVKVGKDSTAFALAGDQADTVLNELELGMFPTFVYQESRGGEVAVSVSAVNFLSAMDQFMSCEDTLLTQEALRIKQEEQTKQAGGRAVDQATVRFGYDSASLGAKGRETLDAITTYYRDNPSTQQVVITGYADTAGNSRSSIQLALARSSQVREYLIKKGIPSAKIKIYYTGEYIPGGKRPRKSERNRQVGISLVE